MFKRKLSKILIPSLALGIGLTLLPCSSATNNNAIAINYLNDIPPAIKKEKIYTDELSYDFRISDKLEGTGTIKLTLHKNKLKGTATGIGKTNQCEVDFLTKLEGALSGEAINVSVKGEGDPLGIPIPGKIAFQGPLKGYFKDNKLCLTGKVHIKGRLARYAGFEETEDLFIEILNGDSLSQTLKKIRLAEKTASL
ncbi:MAG: hypothetical protein A3B68_09720 [Candidatus Melainabacteria bacterium RIFCSPHIGHO2_02_FULL_34_12]|nr:MAG: hypothetical protein A3B68_09720 [Candidatus Melainabacteria bacterium RIFCSPHIGHO2_02_FULL_34_12]